MSVLGMIAWVLAAVVAGFLMVVAWFLVSLARWNRANPRPSNRNHPIGGAVRLVLALFVVAFAAGCVGPMPKVNTKDGLAGMVKTVAPDKAGVVDTIADLLVGKRTNPIAGYERFERWTVKGQPVDKQDIRLDVEYKKSLGVNDSFMSAAPPSGQSTNNLGVGSFDNVPDREQLKAEISAALDILGVK